MSESRKVQRTPTGTFFVCVPRAWAQQNGLQKGSEVTVEVTSDSKLLIDPKYGAEIQPKVTTLPVSPYLSREIVGRYLLGFDTINVEAKERIDPEARKIVKATASSLAGLEIVEETIAKISLQSLMQVPTQSPGKLLQRNHAIAAGMIRDAATAFITNDLELAKNVVERDVESNKFYFLLVRTLRTMIQNPRLSEKLGLTPIECLDYRLAASLIEGIGDACVQLASTTTTLDGAKLSEELRKLLLDLQVICCEANEQAFKAFSSKNIQIAENVRTYRVKIEAKSSDIEQIAKDSSVDLMPQTLAAVSFLRQIYERSVDLADLV